MGNYTVIADAGRSIVEFLRRNCVPPVDKPELIGLCSPDDTGNYSLGVCLYDIDESSELKMARDIVIDDTHVRSAPSIINLHYMIFTSLKTDIAMRAIDEQRILGSVYQRLADHRVLTAEDGISGSLLTGGENLNITFENKPYEDKIKVWTAYNQAPKPCLFYKVTAVAVESDLIRTVRRVTEADISIRQKGNKR